ncbi:phosphatidylinositol 4-kinase, partial [Reticulomyxa filosa]
MQLSCNVCGLEQDLLRDVNAGQSTKQQPLPSTQNIAPTSPSWTPSDKSSNTTKTMTSQPSSVRLPPTSPKESSREMNFLPTRDRSSLGDPFGELWDDRKRRIRSTSNWQCANWGIIFFFFFFFFLFVMYACDAMNKIDLQSVIFKSGEDMRQEQFAMQIIRLFEKIFKDAKLPLQLRPYSVVVTSPASGFVETVT